MKIIHCILSFNTGGAETMLIDIVNEQAINHEVTLIIVNDSYQQELINKIDRKVRIIFIKRTPGSLSILPIIKLNYHIHKIHANAIHLHNSDLTRCIYNFSCSKMFMTVHDIGVPLKNLKKISCLFAISKSVAQYIHSVCDIRTLLVPNGIVLDKIEQKTQRFKESGILKIVNVARLNSDKKGQDILIRAIADLKNKGYNNVEVDFIGTGESENKLKQLTERLKLDDKIHFLGLKDRDYIYKHLKDYDLMCHPSRYEGFGLTVAEGIAAKIPVLVSSGDGPSEIINQGEFGFVFENGNYLDCSTKIMHIINNYDEAIKFVDSALKHVQNNYSVSRMVEQYINAYNSII